MDREKVIKGLEACSTENCTVVCPYHATPQCTRTILIDALTLLKEQEDDYKNILSDYEDLAREHEKLLNKKIPLITNGQEVVRCKDCKHGRLYARDLVDCELQELAKEADWFCADGERSDA